MGQRPILYVVAKQWVSDMEAFLEARLAKYKLPVHIYFVRPYLIQVLENFKDGY